MRGIIPSRIWPLSDWLSTAPIMQPTAISNRHHYQDLVRSDQRGGRAPHPRSQVRTRLSAGGKWIRTCMGLSHVKGLFPAAGI